MKQTNRVLGKFFFTLIILQLSLSGCVASTDSIIKQNRKLIFEDRNYTKAIENLKRAVKKSPNDPELWYWLSVAQFPVVSPDKTLRSLNKAFSLGLPKSKFLALYISGQCNDSLGNYDKAIQHYTDHIELNPKDLKAFEKRGNVYIKVKQFDKAHEDFDIVLQQNKNSIDALRGKSSAYFKAKNYAESIEYLDRLIRITPTNNKLVLSEAYGGRGWSNYHLAQFEKAKKNFDTALGNTPDKNRDAIKSFTIGKAFSHLGLKDPETAIALIDRAEKYSQPGTNLILERTLVYYLSGNKQKAWNVRGGSGMVGLKYRINQTGDQGIYVDAVIKDGPAAESGVLQGDTIISVNRQPVSINNFGKMAAELIPGETAVFIIKREGLEKKINLQAGSFENVLKQHDLSQPILSPDNQIAANEKTSGSTLVLQNSQEKPLDVSGAGETPQLNTNQQKTKTIEITIDAVSIEPEPVKAGKYFKIIIDLIANDPGSSDSELPIVMDYSISRDGKLLKKFKSKDFVVPNGDFHTLIRKPKAGKTKGTYSLSIELGYMDKKARKKISFEIN